MQRCLRIVVGVWQCAALLTFGAQLARLAPSGDGQLTYVSIDATGSALGNDIWLMDVARRFHHNITQSTRTNNRAPAWSPDGRRLAFISDRNGAAQLFVATIPGSPRLLAPLIEQPIAAGYRPVWSPDGRWLVVEIAHVGNTDLYVIDTDCQRRTEGCEDALIRLTDEPTDDRFPVWSSSGEWIAFVSWREGDAEIYSIRADGSDLRDVSNDSRSWDASPSWSPDGEQLMYTALHSGQYQLYLVTMADGFRLPILDGEHQPILPLGSAPVWSADGARVTVAVSVSENAADIMILDMNCILRSLDCAAPTTTIAPSPVDELTPVWSPDERWLYFVSGRQGTLAIYRADVSCPDCAPEPISDTRRYSVSPTFRP